MFQLHFELNDQALSAFKLGPFSYPAGVYFNYLKNAGPTAIPDSRLKAYVKVGIR